MNNEAFIHGVVDELQKLGYNGGAATATIRPGSTESKAMRKALKAKGVWEGKSPGLLQRAAHGLRRLTRPKPTAHLKTDGKPATKAETDKAISSALGGSFSSIPSLPKVASFVQAFVDELEKQGVTFGKSPGKPMKLSARWRRLTRVVSGAPASQLRRMERKRQAQSVAHKFSGAARDLRGMARAGKMTLGAGRALAKREARLPVRAGKRIKGVGPAIAGLIKRNPDIAFLLAAPPAIIGGTAAVGGLRKLLTKKKKKKGMKKTADTLYNGVYGSDDRLVVRIDTDKDGNYVETKLDDGAHGRTYLPKPLYKEAGPPTLAKLRRAYPKGKVKPLVANPAAPKPLDFPKAASQ